MLNHIILFSIRNKLIVGLLTVALIIWGGWSITQLPIDAVPDITNNQVQVITTSPSLSAPDIERLVTFPVEIGLANLPGLIELRSFSRFGLSIVTVVFRDDIDVFSARQQISERLQNVVSQIPPGVGTPTMAPVTTGLGEIFQYTVVPKKGYEQKYPLTELRTIQDWIIRRGLLGTPGVADVSSFGGLVKQYEIAVDPDRLRSMNLTITDLFDALERNNQNTGGAYIDQKPNAYFIRSDGLIGSITDIENVVIKLSGKPGQMNALPIRIRDVATVQIGSAVRYGAVTRNGQGEVVGALVMMLKGENSAKVIKLVKAKIADIRKTLPEGVEIIPFLDRTKMVDSAIGTVTKNLAEGALIVIFVLVLVLGEWRAGFVVASVIPLALLFAIALMNVFGVSGNLMSLGAIDFGLIVDGAVIIVEATLHHMLLRNRDQTLSQLQMDEEVYESASRIRNSAAFGEIIILIVYLPILALSGVEGKMFRPMALTVGFAILGAFILSLTYVPMVSSLVLSKTIRHKNTLSDRFMAWLHRGYEPLIMRALRFRILILAVAVSLLAISVFLFTRMGGEFLPTLDEGDFAVETRVLTGSSLSESADATTKAQRILLKQFPEVEQVVGKSGSGEIPTDPMPIEASDLMIILKPKSEWTSASSREKLAEKMAEALSVIPGVAFGFQQPVQMRFNELMTGARQDVALKIYGEDLGELTRQAEKVGNLIGGIDGAKDLYVEQVEGLTQILVKLNRDQIAKYGLNVADVNRTINTAFAGQSTGQVYEGERRFDLVVRLAADKRRSIDDVRTLYVATATGQQIPLTQLADVTMEQAPNQIQRDNTRRRITLGFNVRGRDVESIITDLQGKVARQIKLPPGYSITYGGQFENLVEAKRRLAIAVPGSLALIFALLFFTFHSVRQSFLIFTAIPMAAIGGVFALLLRGMPFSISAGVGFIALFGVAVLNGIVLIAEFNRLRHEEGLTDFIEIIRRGTQVRLRPVIMTALVASLGFIPMALSNSGGAEVQKPLATVVIGGLITATLLTLFVLPILYTYFERGLERIDPKKPIPSGTTNRLVMIATLVLAALGVNAQSPAIRVVGLDQALQEAATRNARLQIGGLQVNQQRALRRSAFDYGRTTISSTLGQFNSRKFDNGLTISQIFPNPALLRRQADLADATIQGRETAVGVSRNEVQYDVKSAYYAVQYWHEREGLLRQQDSVLAEFVQAATLRFRVGETGSLEKATAESQRADGLVRLAQNTANLAAARTRLQTALYSTDELEVAPGPLTKRKLSVVVDSSGTTNNPLLAQLRQQIVVAEQSRRVEKARLKPEFIVGLSTQTIIGTQIYDGNETYYGPGHRFVSGQIGVLVPLLAKPQKARIEAARLGEQIAQTELATQRRALQQQGTLAFQQYEQYRTALAYYEQNGLAQARLILDNARKAFGGGDIGYVEFSLALQQSLTIRASYLDLLNQYNQSVLYIEYLLGQP
ncbi:CusA/CzcA family heavy metal efflux RND transporter [Spirosoma spitsbergense]|uniref:CusA/CzcA family heavy metal efflux RND transporter n=1 Tax=Spirosoma spitsbergense TaxID=431554 RepID=UPI000373F09A|nr:CusA/CzcA family heavy metal efflux RND transporter [Spirosoma spitsbergense]